MKLTYSILASEMPDPPPPAHTEPPHLFTAKVFSHATTVRWLGEAMIVAAKLRPVTDAVTGEVFFWQTDVDDIIAELTRP